MLTRLTESPGKSAELAEAAEALRRCVECGAANAVCPTFVLLNDDRDSPRGRNRLIRQVLERGGAPTAEEVRHIDRCLSCNACMASCLAQVDFMHLMDTARKHVEANHRRPLGERLLRSLVAAVLPRPGLFRVALALGRLAAPAARLAPAGLRPLLRMAAGVRREQPSAGGTSSPPAQGEGPRVALLAGCVQSVLAPRINAAAERVLRRAGCQVVPAPAGGCCGALTYHMGKESAALADARRAVAGWAGALRRGELDHLVVTASGCGTMLKDYGHIFRHDPRLADAAALVSERTLDISELLDRRLLEGRAPAPLRVAYHPACSLQHAQKVREQPKRLLRRCGFTVVEPFESHLCCGSAGTYNLLQPAIADRLRARKVANIERRSPDVVAAGNLGCMTQIGAGTRLPVVHTVELLDWATGGPPPPGLNA